MVIHGECVQGITQTLLGQSEGSNMITNEEREGTGYFVVGKGVCIAPKYEKN